MVIQSPYTALDRLLHWLALEPQTVRRLCFDLERQLYLPKEPQHAAQGAVYVCGLARSGTTILLRILDAITELQSLTYRAMPFVLAPNLWRATHGAHQRSVPKVMRAHKDGLFVDLDSPEGLEEVFWNTFGHAIRDNTSKTLDYQAPSPATLAAFTDYRALVANPKGGSAVQADRPNVTCQKTTTT